MAIADVWVFRIVHQDTGKAAQGVPVTVLDKGGNAAGHRVSDADGIVAVPRRDIPKLRLRVGLRNEDPIELATATLGEEPTPLAAPTHLPHTTGGMGERGGAGGGAGGVGPRWRSLARVGGRAMPGALVGRRRPERRLDALTLPEPGLGGAAADTVQMVRDRTERMSNALRRRPLGVVDAPADAPATGAVRTVRNTTRDRLEIGRASCRERV